MLESNIVPDLFDSTACSVQSHLSTSNSKQRLRATASSSQHIRIRDQAPLQQPEQFSGFTLFLKRLLFPAPTLPQTAGSRLVHSRPWSTLCLKWAVCTYCLLSLAIFSVTIYMNSSGDRHRITKGASQYSSN
jgi:hypothetical protein